MKNICKFLSILIFLFGSSLTSAEEFPPVSKDKKTFVGKSVENWLKGRYKVDGVSKTPIQEILEVRIGNELIYVDSQASYAIVEGRMINLKSGLDLTAQRLEKILTIDFSSLPLELAIKTQIGTGNVDGRTIVVFEDPYCSYCKKYRMTLEKITNLTIYTFLFPILSQESVEVSREIWCSDDQAKAWGDFILQGIKPNKSKKDCKFPKDNLLALGKKLGINATPTSYLISGKRISGAVNQELLEREFSQL
jgi:thiol:disulfide interchange protein DsbC